MMLAALVVTARWLGRSQYGELGIVQSTMMMFTAFAAFGLGLTSTKHIAGLRETDKMRAGRIIGLSSLVAIMSGGIMAAVVFGLSPWLASRTLGAPYMAGTLRIGAGILFFGAMSAAQTGALSGFEAYKEMAKANILSGPLGFVLVVGGARLLGVNGAVIGLVLSQAASWFINRLVLIRVARQCRITITYRGCMREKGILWSYAVPAALSSAMVAPALWVCNAMLVNASNGFSEMGVLTAAGQWGNILGSVSLVLAAPHLPVLAGLAAVGSKKQFDGGMRMTVAANGLFLVPAAAILIVFSEPIMAIYGQGFREHACVMRVMVLCATAASITSSYGRALAGLNKIWVSLLLNGLWASIAIVACHYYAHEGALGIAKGQLLAYGVHTFTVFYVARYIIRKAFRRKRGIGEG